MNESIDIYKCAKCGHIKMQFGSVSYPDCPHGHGQMNYVGVLPVQEPTTH